MSYLLQAKMWWHKQYLGRSFLWQLRTLCIKGFKGIWWVNTLLALSVWRDDHGQKNAKFQIHSLFVISFLEDKNQVKITETFATLIRISSVFWNGLMIMTLPTLQRKSPESIRSGLKYLGRLFLISPWPILNGLRMFQAGKPISPTLNGLPSYYGVDY